MPLPVPDVSEETATRILKAFEGMRDDETAEDLSPEDAYLAWWKRVLLEKVVSVETQVAAAALQQELM